MSERWKTIQVKVTVPIPADVTNETQAHALSREAAIARGQYVLLTYALQQKTRSGKKLSEAETPSPELQDRIRGTIKGARVVKTTWGPTDCTVILSLDKSRIKEILRKN